MTVKDFADDVQHVLADEPVTVFADPVIVRAQRWIKRHRTLATTAAATLLVGVASLCVLVVITSQHVTEVEGKNLDLQQAKLRERIRNSEPVFSYVSTPDFSRLKAASQQSQLAMLALFAVSLEVDRSHIRAKAEPNSAEKQRKLVISHAKLGLVHRSTKDFAKSVADFETALQIARSLKQKGLLAEEIDGLIDALEAERKESEQLRDASPQ